MLKIDEEDENEDELNLDWLQEAQTLCNQSEDYVPMPYIRVVNIFANSGEYQIKQFNRAEFECTEGRPFTLNPSDKHIIRDIALFHVDIQKHQLSCIPSVKYVSFDSVSNIRERLIELHSFPCFFDLFELLVVLDEKPVIAEKPSSILKGNGSNGKRGNSQTRKQVRFHTNAGQTKRHL